MQKLNTSSCKMIESFYIQNFKNFKDLAIPQLKRINLIVGKNSVGKSTLLEALALYLSEGDENCLKDLLMGRGENIPFGRQAEDSQELVKERCLSLFHGWKENYSKDFFIRLGEDLEKQVVIQQVLISEGKALTVYHQEDLDETNNRLAVSTKGLMAIRTDGDFDLFRYDRSQQYLSKSYKRVPYLMVRTIDFESSANASLYDKITLSPLEDYIVRALNIINVDIDRITFVTEETGGNYRIPVVSLKGSGQRVRLTSLGDGVNRVLTIILSLLNCKGGVLLLDEFETGLHYSVQKQLWEAIFMLAEQLDIQVFVTTHSSDCLNAFSKVNADGQGMLIRLEQRKNMVAPVCYIDNQDIAFAAENNIELR